MSDAISPSLKEIKECVRQEENRHRQLEDDLNREADETFCDRAPVGLYLRLIAVSPEYFRESGETIG